MPPTQPRAPTSLPILPTPPPHSDPPPPQPTTTAHPPRPRIARTGLVERSVAAAVISAARHRALTRKPRHPPPASQPQSQPQPPSSQPPQPHSHPQQATTSAQSRQPAPHQRSQAAADWPSHHRPHGGFANPWDSAYRPHHNPLVNGNHQSSVSSNIGLRTRTAIGSRTFFHKVAKDRRPPDEQLATMLLLATRPKFDDVDDVLRRDKYALASFWIGHATFVICIKGVTILTDPVWAVRLGPLGPRRLVPPACSIDELPQIDVVLLSSANYDHFDKVAVGMLKNKVGVWCCPLGVKSLLLSAGVPAAKVIEMDWWDSRTIAHGVKVVCTPSQGSSVREDTLWSSWVVQGAHHRLFYCGGTGYRAVSWDFGEGGKELIESFEQRRTFGGPACPAFKEIQRRCGSMDTAFLPIGGFKPRLLMSGTQGDAMDMLFIHRDLKAKRSVAHRWGTFACNEEGMLDAVRCLEAALLNSPIAEHEVNYVRHGSTHVT